MANTTVNLADPVSTFVDKTNTISNHLGDKANLTTTDKTDLVSAINEINGLVNASLNEESEIQNLIRDHFSGSGAGEGNVTLAGTTSLDILDMSEATDSAVITDISGVSSTFTTHQGANGNFDNSAIGSLTVNTGLTLDGINGLAHLKEFKVINSAGSTVLAGYLISTNNLPGTL